MEGKINFDYVRVIPRDLFNTSMLLKCIGQLVLLMLDNKLDGLTHDETGEPFMIGEHEAGYFVENSITFTKINNEETLFFGIPINSRNPYPLVCVYDWEDIQVFNNDGTITEQFQEFLIN
jgi:hypothetical protein